jgi:hypothetical protein
LLPFLASRYVASQHAAPVGSAAQKTDQAYVGVWKGEYQGKTFCVLKLKVTQDKLSGTIAAGGVEIGEDGEVNQVSQEADNEIAISEIKNDGARLSFKAKDGPDLDEYDMELTGETKAELRLRLPADEAKSVPALKPFKLTRIPGRP